MPINPDGNSISTENTFNVQSQPCLCYTEWQWGRWYFVLLILWVCVRGFGEGMEGLGSVSKWLCITIISLGWRSSSGLHFRGFSVYLQGLPECAQACIHFCAWGAWWDCSAHVWASERGADSGGCGPLMGRSPQERAARWVYFSNYQPTEWAGEFFEEFECCRLRVGHFRRKRAKSPLGAT